MGAKRTKLRGKRIGLMTVDPGRTTGVTISTPLLHGTAQEIFERDPIQVMQIDCQNLHVDEELCELEGTNHLLDEFGDARQGWLDAGIPEKYHYFVIEDFVLRGKLGGTERSGLSSVRVTSGLLLGLHLQGWHPKIVFQQPADAKGTITNDRLKAWGLWTRGLEHGRDATRHAALFVRRATTA